MTENRPAFTPTPLTLRNRFYMSVVLPTVERGQFQGVAARIRHYQAVEKRPLEENKVAQWRELQRVLLHAYESSPFYRARFEALQLHPSEIQTPDDLQRLPVLTKTDIAEQGESMVSSRFDRSSLQVSRTGGTTNASVSFLRERACSREKYAAQLQFQMWAGMAPGERVAYMWGSTWDFPQTTSWRWKLYDQHLMGRIWMPALDIEDSALERFRLRYNDFRPRILYGYSGTVARLAEYALREKKDLYPPHAIICTAEELGARRSIIEKAFGARVFEHYGSREMGIMSAECECGKMHLNPETTFVEFQPLAKSPNSELREMIVTDLKNFGMPLIRYKTCDSAIPKGGGCACGRGYEVIDQIVGRSATTFRMPDGRVVFGLNAVLHVSPAVPRLRQAQFIQETLTSYRMKYVTDTPFTDTEIKAVRGRLDQFFGMPLNWEFERVSEIPLARSGKSLNCISLLND